MAIDSNALSSINNALSSLGISNKQKDNSYASDVQRLTMAAASVSTQTRYKQAFEDKLKLAGNSEDTVELSDKSLNALREYVSLEKKSAESKSPTYDYATLKKQREANLKAIQAEVEQKYGHKTEQAADANQSERQAAEPQSSVLTESESGET